MIADKLKMAADNRKAILKKALIFAGILAFFVILAYSFVPQVLQGKIVNQGDISSWKGMANEAVSYNKAHPEDKTAWTDSMFGGMPTTATIDDFDGDWTKALYKVLLVGKRPASYLFVTLLGAFLMFLAFGCGRVASVAGAVAVAFCAYNMQIIQVGHNTKMQAIAFFPWVLAGVAFTYRKALEHLDASKKSWITQTVAGSVLFALALSFQIKANHPQITYYLAIAIFVYALTLLLWLCFHKEERKRKLQRFFTASALLLVIGCVGIATNANKLIPTYKYAEYTMRGGSELAEDVYESDNADGKETTVTDANGKDKGKSVSGSNKDKAKKDNTKGNSQNDKGRKGLDIEYATSWSYGINEMPNLLIPNFNGGASACDPHIKNGATESLLRQYGQPNVEDTVKHLPMYWGPQPFTAGPMYLGAVSIFLCILALFLFKGKDRRHAIWISVATLIAILLSWGSHFMWFTKLWFDYAPMYNKFRTVSMALTMLQVTVPLLGFMALDRIIKEEYGKKEIRKAVLWSLGITGGFCLVMALFPGIAGDFRSPSDSNYPDILADAFREDRCAMLRKDAVRSLLLILGAAGVLLWTSLTKKPFTAKGRTYIAGGAIAVLVIVDMFPVGKRYLNKDHFISPRNFEKQFAERPVDKIVLEDSDPCYRVFDLSKQNPFNDAHPSYRHKSIGGYSPVKLQRYQDLIDRYLSKEERSVYSAIGKCETIGELEDSLPYMRVTSMLNGRYIIIGDDFPPVVNHRAMGHCWTVNGFDVTGSPNEEIDMLASVDLAECAVLGPDFSYVAEEFANMRKSNQGGCYVEMTSYEPNELHYDYSSSSDAAVVFSEIYYPDGWKAWIGPKGDVGSVRHGKFVPSEAAEEVNLFRCNWMLRGLLMPEGDYEIVMRFEPHSYVVGKNVSTASSALLILLLLLSIAGTSITAYKSESTK